MRESDEYQVSQLFSSPSRRGGGLGDLTESKKEERNEFAQTSGSIVPKLLPSADTKLAPKVQSGTVPIYNTLPANGGRFAFGQANNLAIVEPELANTVQVFLITVPHGRVLIANEFRVNVEDVLNLGVSIGIPTVPFNISIFLNNQAEVFNQNITIQALDNYYPCYVIGGPGDVVTISATFDFSVIGAFDQVDFISHLRGDMLIQNELQTQYTGLRQTALPTFSVDK